MGLGFDSLLSGLFVRLFVCCRSRRTKTRTGVMLGKLVKKAGGV
jgi:hypothetical protein